MGAVVKTRLVRIGNSQGIRIPRVVVQQAGLKEQIELEVRNNQLVVRSASRPRQGWEGRFRAMAEQGDDRLVWPEGVTLASWDQGEWEW